MKLINQEIHRPISFTMNTWQAHVQHILKHMESITTHTLHRSGGAHQVQINCAGTSRHYVHINGYTHWIVTRKCVQSLLIFEKCLTVFHIGRLRKSKFSPLVLTVTFEMQYLYNGTTSLLLIYINDSIREKLNTGSFTIMYIH